MSIISFEQQSSKLSLMKLFYSSPKGPICSLRCCGRIIKNYPALILAKFPIDRSVNHLNVSVQWGWISMDDSTSKQCSIHFIRR
jgi:hypothetical protein